MVLSQQEFQSLCIRLQKMRGKSGVKATEDIPPGIKLLHSMREDVTEEADYVALTTLLQSEYSWYGLIAQQEEICREMAERFQEEPMPWITLAEFLLSVREDPHQAMAAIDIGLENALMTGNFVRHAYNTKARIARKLDDYKLIESILGKLLAYKPSHGSQDVNYEKDYLEGISENEISSDLFYQYLELIKKPMNKG
jgi:hypothetical protein